jgi:hypothetical protein
MITKLTNINSNNLESIVNNIILNKSLTNVSPTNMYEILFDCEIFDNIFNIFLEKIKEHTTDDFEVYVKNMWGYIKNENETKSIDFNINFKNQIIIPSNYSFIYLIESNTSNIHLKKENGNTEIISLNKGDLLIFKTEDFLNDECGDINRIALIGSIAKVTNTQQITKKVML